MSFEALLKKNWLKKSIEFICIIFVFGCSQNLDQSSKKGSSNEQTISFCRIPLNEKKLCKNKISVVLPNAVQVFSSDKNSFITGGSLSIDLDIDTGDIIRGERSIDPYVTNNLMRIRIMALQYLPQRKLFNDNVNSSYWNQAADQDLNNATKFVSTDLPNFVAYLPEDENIDGVITCGKAGCKGQFRTEDVSFQIYFSRDRIQEWEELLRLTNKFLNRHIKIENIRE